MALRNRAYLVSVAACGALLASCGSNSTDPAPTPTPTTTGTATPTPTPTSAGPLNFDFSEDFITVSAANYIFAYFTPTAGSPAVRVFSDASRRDGTSGVNYDADPETVLFGFPDLSSNVQFVAAERTQSSATTRTYSRTDELLRLFVPFSQVLRATYMRTDSSVQATVPGSLESSRVGLFANAVTTTDAITSTLTYTGTPALVGGDPGVTSANVFGTQSTFSVTTAGALTGTISVFVDNTNPSSRLAQLSFSGTVTDAGTFAADITDSTSTFTGRFAGGLAGANRDEILVVFSATNPDGEKIVGSLIGAPPPRRKRQPFQLRRSSPCFRTSYATESA